jgi:ABC-type polysaccharide/polyol phosphate export permease
MEYHPITYFAALFQKPIYTAIWPSDIDWLVSVSISLLTVFTGYYLIQKFKNKFYFYL